ncbi:uncharacterized protein LOC131892438 [Tigriopus californicus]|uniref:uncharacterized protein LOC131892438 n=1 Tax=Tigriopus californicus TaxID=6832 RepID=UPI0027D9DCE7|nr:uncharacterized protein LOC131892438 [Tigriopus californicus]
MADTITFPPQALDILHWIARSDPEELTSHMVEKFNALLFNPYEDQSRNVQVQFPACLQNPPSSWLLKEAMDSKDLSGAKGESIMAPVLKERPQSDWLLPTIIHDDQHKFVYSAENDRVPEIPSNSMWLSASSTSSDSIMDDSKSIHSNPSSQWLAYQPESSVSVPAPQKKHLMTRDPEMSKWLEITKPSLPESLDGWLLPTIMDVPDLSSKAPNHSNNDLVEMWLNLVTDVVEALDEDIHDCTDEVTEGVDDEEDDSDSFAVIEFDRQTNDQTWLL